MVLAEVGLTVYGIEKNARWSGPCLPWDRQKFIRLDRNGQLMGDNRRYIRRCRTTHSILDVL